MAAPAPRITRSSLRRILRWFLIPIYVILFCVTTLSWWLDYSSVLFAAQVTLLTTTLCVIPTVTPQLIEDQHTLAYATVETLLFVALLLGFGLWVFGPLVLGIWIAYAVALLLLLEVGSHVT